MIQPVHYKRKLVRLRVMLIVVKYLVSQIYHAIDCAQAKLGIETRKISRIPWSTSLRPRPLPSPGRLLYLL